MADDRNDAELIEGSADSIASTIDKIEEKLNPRDIVDSFVSGDGMDNAKQLWSVVKENPIPAALIAVGTGWLLATSQTPAIRDLRERLVGKFGGGGDGDFNLRSRSDEPAPIGPPRESGAEFDRRS